MPTEGTSSYSYAAEPQAVKPGAKSKYRDEREIAPLSLMSDPRVVRGSTQALARKIIGQKSVNKATLRLKQTQQRERELEDRSARPAYIYDVPPFASEELDISQYLTDGIDSEARKNAMIAKLSQTDEFNPKPPSPKYVPRKTGRDNTTQVEDVRELFDFDREVAPMLDVIVAKTIEQALFEVETEEELRRVARAIKDFEAKKEVENEWRASKEKETMAQEEKMRQDLEVMRQRAEVQNELKNKVAGVQMVRQIYPAIWSEIEAEFFPVGSWDTQVVQNDFGAALVQGTTEKAKLLETASEVLTEILEEAQTRYQDRVPEFVPAAMPQCTITVVMEKPAAEGEGEGEGEAASAPSTEVNITVGDKDTVNDVEKAIVAALAEKEVTGVDPKLLPFLMTTTGRSIARDARVLNFTLPEALQLNISLSE